MAAGIAGILIAIVFATSAVLTDGDSARYERMLDTSVLVEIKRGERRLGHGSGAILPNGDILTAGHITQRIYKENRRPDAPGPKTTWTVVYGDGTETKGRVLRSDFDTSSSTIDADLGLLRPEDPHTGPRYSGAPINCKPVGVGTEIHVAGNPAVLRRAVTAGIVISTTHRSGDWEENSHAWLQTDATVYGGNSGGPVFANGDPTRIAGIVSHGMVGGQGRAPTGHNFAVPGDVICDYLNLRNDDDGRHRHAERR